MYSNNQQTSAYFLEQICNLNSTVILYILRTNAQMLLTAGLYEVVFKQNSGLGFYSIYCDSTITGICMCDVLTVVQPASVSVHQKSCINTNDITDVQSQTTEMINKVKQEKQVKIKHRPCTKSRQCTARGKCVNKDEM